MQGFEAEPRRQQGRRSEPADDGRRGADARADVLVLSPLLEEAGLETMESFWREAKRDERRDEGADT